MRIPDIRPAQGATQAQQVVSQPNMLQGIGQSMEAFGQLKMQKEDRDTRAWLTKAKADAQIGVATRVKELTEQGVSNISEQLVKDIDGIYKPILDTAPNDRAREEWDSIGYSLRANFLEKAINTEIELKRKNSLMDYNNLTDNTIKSLNDGTLSYDEAKPLLEESQNVLFGTDELERTELTGRKYNEFILAATGRALADGDNELYQNLVSEAKEKADASTYTKILKAGEEQRTEDAIVSDLADITNFENPQQPKFLVGDNLTEKNLNTGYNKLFAEDIKNGNALAQASFNKAVATFGIIPTDFTKDLKSTFLKDNPYEKAGMFAMVDTLVTSNPRMVDQLSLSEKQKTEIEMTNFYTKIGIDSNTIKQRVSDMYNLPDDVVKDRKKMLVSQAGSNSPEVEPDMDIGALVSDNTVAGFVYSSIDLPENANDKAVMENSFTKVFEREYILTGDAEYAQAAAEKYFKVTHGTTNITGVEQVMAFPPEKAASNPLYTKADLGQEVDYSENVEWQRKQLETDIRQWERIPTGKQVDLSKYKLSAEPRAARNRAEGKPIGYYVQRKEDDGGWTALGLKIYFDPAKEMQFKKEEIRKGAVKARESRIKKNEQFLQELESGKTPQWQGM